jgi:hypothetical protein
MGVQELDAVGARRTNLADGPLNPLESSTTGSNLFGNTHHVTMRWAIVSHTRSCKLYTPILSVSAARRIDPVRFLAHP